MDIDEKRNASSLETDGIWREMLGLFSVEENILSSRQNLWVKEACEAKWSCLLVSQGGWLEGKGEGTLLEVIKNRRKERKELGEKNICIKERQSEDEKVDQ